MKFNGTGHNSATKKDIAKRVLLTGDPMRSKMIAEKYLTNIRLVNNVRGVQGYTGKYKGQNVTVMGAGMGNPSMGIYSYELFNFYDVDRIVRLGTAGGVGDDICLKDIVLSQRVLTNTNYANFFAENGENYINANSDLINTSIKIAKSSGINLKVVDSYCTDTFYGENIEHYKQMNITAMEMEGAALYLNAQKANKQAIVLLSISDIPEKRLSLSTEERQNSIDELIRLSLDVVIAR